MRDFFLLIAVGCILILCLFACSSLYRKARNQQQQLEYVVNGAFASRRPLKEIMRDKVVHTSAYQKHYESITLLLKQTYAQDKSTDQIIQWEVQSLLFGLGAMIIIQIIFSIWFLSFLVILGAVLCALYPYLQLKNRWKARQDEFDDMLPQFLIQMCLGFDSGASIDRAMHLAIQTMEDEVRLDFNQLLVDYKMHPDDLSLAFDRLAIRMPTKECQRFCNVTTTGLKNGNEMEQILRTEVDYMNREAQTKLEEKGKKKENLATVIDMVFIFIPVIGMLLLPLASSMQ